MSQMNIHTEPRTTTRKLSSKVRRLVAAGIALALCSQVLYGWYIFRVPRSSTKVKKVALNYNAGGAAAHTNHFLV